MSILTTAITTLARTFGSQPDEQLEADRVMVRRRAEYHERRQANEQRLADLRASVASDVERQRIQSEIYTEERKLTKLFQKIHLAEQRLLRRTEPTVEERQCLTWREAYGLLIEYWQGKLEKARAWQRNLERQVEAASRDCTIKSRQDAHAAAQAELAQYIETVIQPLEDELLMFEEQRQDNERAIDAINLRKIEDAVE